MIILQIQIGTTVTIGVHRGWEGFESPPATPPVAYFEHSTKSATWPCDPPPAGLTPNSAFGSLKISRAEKKHRKSRCFFLAGYVFRRWNQLYPSLLLICDKLQKLGLVEKARPSYSPIRSQSQFSSIQSLKLSGAVKL